MPFLNLIFIFLLATVAANFEDVAPSTWTRETCLTYLQNEDICDDPCHKEYSSAFKLPGIDRLDADFDAKKTVQVRANLARYTDYLIEHNITRTCEGIAFCSAYLHKCQTCGTSSIWHRSEFLDSNGEIQVHPVIGNQKRTMNGFEPVRHSAPWNVYVQSVSNYGTGVCGGTLIDAYTVVTAAHCVKGRDYTNLYFGVHERCLTMTAGCKDIGTGHFNFNVTEVGIQYRVVKPNNTIIHEDYLSAADGLGYLTKSQNDIAILKLDVPVLFSHKVSPACLPTGLPVDHYRHGNKSHLFLAGAWGLNEAYTFGYYYRQIVVQEQQYASEFGTPDMWIGVRHPFNGDENSKFRSVCGGDSGSGLMAIVDKKWVVVGLASHGPECEDNNRAGTGEYTNVIKYLPWIKQRMGE